jgi:hypothetical protein
MRLAQVRSVDRPLGPMVVAASGQSVVRWIPVPGGRLTSWQVIVGGIGADHDGNFRRFVPRLASGGRPDAESDVMVPAQQFGSLELPVGRQATGPNRERERPADGQRRV